MSKADDDNRVLEEEKVIKHYIDGANLSELSKRVGLSRQSLYNYMRHGGHRHRFAHALLKDHVLKK